MEVTGSTPLRKVVIRTKARRGKAKAPVETETGEKATTTRRINDPSQKMGKRTVAQAVKAEASHVTKAQTAVQEPPRCVNCISKESAKPGKVAQEDTTHLAVSFNAVTARRGAIASSLTISLTQRQQREVTMTKATHRATIGLKGIKVRSDVAEVKAGATTVNAARRQEARRSAFHAPG